MTTGLGKGLEDAMKDTGFESQDEDSLTLTPEQEATWKEFLTKMDAVAIKDRAGEIDVIPDMLLISEFHSWLHKNKLGYSDDLRVIFERSWRWVEVRRKYEAQIGILESEALCWLYSREQLRKIEANPTDEGLYGLVILPHERQKAIKASKEYHDYVAKKESGYFDRLATEYLKMARGETLESQQKPKPAEIQEQPKTASAIAKNDSKSMEPEPVWSDARGEFLPPSGIKFVDENGNSIQRVHKRWHFQ